MATCGKAMHGYLFVRLASLAYPELTARRDSSMSEVVWVYISPHEPSMYEGWERSEWILFFYIFLWNYMLLGPRSNEKDGTGTCPVPLLMAKSHFSTLQNGTECSCVGLAASDSVLAEPAIPAALSTNPAIQSSSMALEISQHTVSAPVTPLRCSNCKHTCKRSPIAGLSRQHKAKCGRQPLDLDWEVYDDEGNMQFRAFVV
ncbi:hypothetical protein GGX14DRAFT_654051 [Mycena pura]|uniref:Uncharacterized protein n=1 Tax=Mycena pura TaxID=153505 RepID=A0AAD6YAF2_9AGAR|nr:hypothetical protein GGX14DRAFT_654051 [Mycena pura]